MNRRAATDADLKVGAIVYKGNGKVAYKIWRTDVVTSNGPWQKAGIRAALQAVTSKSAPASRYYRADALTVEVPEAPQPTGMDTLRELLSFD